MRPSGFLTVFFGESVRDLTVGLVVEASLRLFTVDKAKFFRNLEHVRVHWNRLWAIHRKKGNTVSHLTPHSLQQSKLRSYFLQFLAPESSYPGFSAFLFDSFKTSNYVGGSVAEAKFTEFLLGRLAFEC